SNLQGADFSLASFTTPAQGGGVNSFSGATLGPGTVFKTSSGILSANFSGAYMDGVVFASGGGAQASPIQVSALLQTIDSTSSQGVVINNQQFIKTAGGQFYSVTGTGDWQPIAVTLGPPYVQNTGDVVPAGGGIQPDPAPENGGGGVVEFGQ
ncbi:MAG: hypothetical protein ACR2J9_02075, partial [Gaiellales bacterium]